MSEEVQSPFLQGTNIQFAWDSTSLGYLKTCPRLYYYQMIEGWSSHAESIHLRFGIEYHKALQDYDIHKAAGATHEAAVQWTIHDTLVRTADFRPTEAEYGKAAKHKSRDNLIRTVVWYLDQFKDDPAKTHILQDGSPAVELSFRFELSWGPQHQVPITEEELNKILNTQEGQAVGQPYLLCGHLDRVVNFNDDLYPMDRKTTTTTPGQYFFNQFEPNNQMSLYTLAAKVILEAPIRGIIIDAAQIGIDFSRFHRGFTYRTEDQVQEWVDDLAYWLNLAEGYAVQNYWPQNDTACDKFGGCRFREICSKSPQVRDKFLASNFVKGEKWNPLKPR